METPEHVEWSIGISRQGWYQTLAGHMSPIDLARAVREEVARLAGVTPGKLTPEYDIVIDKEVADILSNFRRTSQSLDERLKELFHTG